MITNVQIEIDSYDGADRVVASASADDCFMRCVGDDLPSAMAGLVDKFNTMQQALIEKLKQLGILRFEGEPVREIPPEEQPS